MFGDSRCAPAGIGTHLLCDLLILFSLSKAERRQPVPHRAQLGAGQEHQERQNPVWALLPWTVGGSPELHEEQPESQILVRDSFKMSFKQTKELCLKSLGKVEPGSVWVIKIIKTF